MSDTKGFWEGTGSDARTGPSHVGVDAKGPLTPLKCLSATENGGDGLRNRRLHKGSRQGKEGVDEAVDVSPANAPRASQSGPRMAVEGGLAVSKPDAPGHGVIRFYS